MTDLSRSERRAQRLLRWYPLTWRERYGEEFAALLAADLDDRPRSWTRDANVRWHGAKARLVSVGPHAGPLRDLGTARATRIFATACFLASATGVWAQILNNSSSAPMTHAPVAGMRIVIGTTFGLLCIEALVALVALTRRSARAVRGEGFRPLGPAFLTLGVGISAFVAGLVTVWSNLHFRLTFASVTQVVTFSLSPKWLFLRHLPHPVVAWMILSPFAFVSIAAGLAQLQRVVPTPRRRRVWPWQTALLVPTWLVTDWWAIGSQNYQNPLLQAHRTALLLIAVMAISLLVAAATERDLATTT